MCIWYAGVNFELIIFFTIFFNIFTNIFQLGIGCCQIYISDAQNNDPYNANYQDFDAKSAGVFFGLGRRFNLSAKFSF